MMVTLAFNELSTKISTFSWTSSFNWSQLLSKTLYWNHLINLLTDIILYWPRSLEISQGQFYAHRHHFHHDYVQIQHYYMPFYSYHSAKLFRQKNDLSKNEIISKCYLTGSVRFLEIWQSPIPYIGIVSIKNFWFFCRNLKVSFEQHPKFLIQLACYSLYERAHNSNIMEPYIWYWSLTLDI